MRSTSRPARLLAVTLQGADEGDTTTIVETTIAAAEQVEDAQAHHDEPQALEEIVADMTPGGCGARICAGIRTS